MLQTASHCNKQQPFDVCNTKPRVRCSHELITLGYRLTSTMKANNNGVI